MVEMATRATTDHRTVRTALPHLCRRSPARRANSSCSPPTWPARRPMPALAPQAGRARPARPACGPPL